MEGKFSETHPQLKHISSQQKSVTEEWTPTRQDSSCRRDTTPRGSGHLFLSCAMSPSQTVFILPSLEQWLGEYCLGLRMLWSQTVLYSTCLLRNASAFD